MALKYSTNVLDILFSLYYKFLDQQIKTAYSEITGSNLLSTSINSSHDLYSNPIKSEYQLTCGETEAGERNNLNNVISLISSGV